LKSYISQSATKAKNSAIEGIFQFQMVARDGIDQSTGYSIGFKII